MELEAPAPRHPPLAAVANYGALPVDMLLDILLRLPADVVCRLRLVCRSWLSLTSNSLFARAHASRHPAIPHCMLGHVPTTGEYKVLRIQADYFSRQQRQACEVVTLGGGGDAGRWRRRPCPPVIVGIVPGSSSWNVAVVAGLAYFLIDKREDMEPGRLAVFDLATEEWKTATLQGPLTSLIASTDDEESDIYEFIRQHVMPGYDHRPRLLRRKHFQLARLSDHLVVFHCNIKNGSTDLWFLEDMEDDVTARWRKRYTLQSTPFGDDESSPQYHYPLEVLDDGRILVCGWIGHLH